MTDTVRRPAMIVMGIVIPQAAVDAGTAVISGDFHSEDVRGAVAAKLHDLYHEGGEHARFDYGAVNRHALHDRIADRLVQKAKKAGVAVHVGGGRWKARPAG